MTDPTEPTDPTDPTEPTDPTASADPTEPTDPTASADQTEQTGPTDPTAAADQTEQTGPTDASGRAGPAEATESSGSAPDLADHEPIGEGHRGSGGVDDRAVPWRVFLAIGGLVTALGLIYWFTSHEDAGSVLLALSAVLAIWCGTYLWLQLRQQRRAAGQEVPPPAEAEATPYLPHASVWPFAIGLGAATVLNGLVLGIWVMVPGAALMALGVGGFVRQTRHRD